MADKKRPKNQRNNKFSKAKENINKTKENIDKVNDTINSDEYFEEKAQREVEEKLKAKITGKDKADKNKKEGKKNKKSSKKNVGKKAFKRKALIGAAKTGGAVGLLKYGFDAVMNFFRKMILMLQAMLNAIMGALSGGILGLLGSAWAGITGALSSAWAFITGLSAKAVAAVVATGAIAVSGAVSIWDTATSPSRFDGNAVDCVDEVDEKSKAYGEGEIKIPEKIKGMDTGYATTWECDLDWAKANINKNSFQWKAVEMWAGPDGTARDEKGFGRVKDYYLVAIRVNAFGMKPDEEANIGDHITFYLSDGTAIETMVWDAKGPTAGPGFDYMNGTPKEEEHSMPGHGRFNGWGHIHPRNPDVVGILEFAGLAPLNNHFELITGKKNVRVTSATNHGPAPEWVDHLAKGSGAAGSTQTRKKSKSKNMGKARDVCLSSKVGKYDNSSIARAATSFAEPYVPYGENGTALYQRVHDNVGSTAGYMDCGAAVCSAVLWSGADDDFPTSYTVNIDNYGKSSKRWKFVGTLGQGGTLKYEDMSPGDVLVVDANGQATGHTFLYVGNEIAKEFHGDKLEDPTADSMEASLDEYAAGMSTATSRQLTSGDVRGVYNVYRCVDPMNSPKFKNAGEK